MLGVPWTDHFENTEILWRKTEDKEIWTNIETRKFPVITYFRDSKTRTVTFNIKNTYY